MERLLITGVDTTVGSNLALVLAERFDVLGLYARQAVESPHVRTAPLDETDRAGVEEVLGDWRPRWLIHCGLFSAASWDEVPDDAAAHREPQFAKWLAELAAETPARLTVISSDVVYAGPLMFHEEGAGPTNASPRAQRVLAVEKAVDDHQAMVVRTHTYGWSPIEGCRGFAERAYAALSGGAAPAADGVRHATPILATDLADLLVRAYELRVHGLFHLAGAERTSPFRFVRELAAACGLCPPCQVATEADDRATAWSAETSLNSKRARRALQLPMPLLRDGLSRFALQAAGGWRDKWRAADRAAGVHQMVA